MATFREVLEAARGRWPQLITQLAPRSELEEAIARSGRKHTDCPVHGASSKKPFRVFNDFADTGGVVCSSCGPKRNGIDTIAWLTGWDAVEVRNKLADELGLSKDPSKRKAKAQPQSQSKPGAEEPPPPSDEDLGAHIAAADEEEAQISSSERPQQPAARPARPARSTRAKKAPAAQPTPQQAATPTPDDVQIDAKKKAEIKRVWDESLPLDDKKAAPARAYLESRQLPLTMLSKLQDVRFHPKLTYFDEDEKGNLRKSYHPAIVLAVRRPSGGIATLHRIYLDKKGHKADVECPKKLMAAFSNVPLSGSAIRLAPQDGRTLGIAEGPETALAVTLATGMPVWAVVSAPLMKSFQPPDGVKRIIIWADKDRSCAGEDAAETMAEALREQGYTVRITYPRRAIPRDAKGIDWLDVLTMDGAEAFPYRNQTTTTKKSAAKKDRAPWEYGSRCPHPTMTWDDISVPAIKRQQMRAAA